MTQTKTTKKWSLKHGAFIALSGFLSPTLLAEDIPEDNLVEQVMVTGSLIAKDNTTSAAPISVFSAEDIKAGGYMSVGDFIANIPSVNGGNLGANVNNGNRGNSTVNLRGLGSNRTLVLVNGNRLVSGGPAGFTDLNMIPTGAIEKIEILRNGGSTAYGSDAIAGVVNIITKTDFEGINFNFQTDITSRMDGRKNLYSLTFGDQSEKGNYVVSAQYRTQQAISQADRKFSECPKREGGGEVFCGGSLYSDPGVAIDISGDDPIFYVKDPATGEKRLFDAERDSYNYAASSYMVTPQEVFNLFATTNYMVTEGNGFSSINAYSQASFANRTSKQQMAPVGTFFQPFVPEANPGNDFGSPVILARRLTETGGRVFTQDANTWNFVTGLNGEIELADLGWNWDVSFNYGTWTDTQVVYGQANQPRIEEMLDPAACEANGACPGVWDPFVSNSLTDEMLKYAIVTHSPVSKARMLQFKASLAGDFLGVEIPFGGLPQWALGFEHRGEKASFTPDGGALLGEIYGVSNEVTEGSYNVKEFLAETRIPILKDLTGARDLTIEALARYTNYDYIKDNDWSLEGAINYSPIDDIRLRYTYTEGFRAANIQELGRPITDSAETYTDPCIDWADPDSKASDTVKVNCAAEGLPGDFSLAANQADAVLGGNPELKPETSVSQTFGVIITPSVLENFSATFDVFQIKIDDYVGSLDINKIVSDCYGSANFGNSACSKIRGPEFVDSPPYGTPEGAKRRNASGVISGLILQEQNLANYETSGLDFSFNYLTDVGFANLTARLNGTYLFNYKYRETKESEWSKFAGKFSTVAYNKLKTNLDIGLFTDSWRVNWIARYQSGVEDANPSEVNTANSIDDYIYHDVMGSYTYGPLTLSAGVRNLFDKEPPYVTNYDDMNTINYNYDTAGRYFFTGLSMQF